MEYKQICKKSGDEIPGLLRDTKTLAIINNDKNGLEKYLAERERILKERQEIESLKKDVNEKIGRAHV